MLDDLARPQVARPAVEAARAEFAAVSAADLRGNAERAAVAGLAVERGRGGDEHGLDELAVAEPKEEFLGRIVRAEPPHRSSMELQAEPFAERRAQRGGQVGHRLESLRPLAVNPIEQLAGAEAGLAERHQPRRSSSRVSEVRVPMALLPSARHQLTRFSVPRRCPASPLFLPGVNCSPGKIVLFFPMNLQQTIGRLSERYQVSAEAVSTLAEAMRRGGNRMAQFSHPDLGGHGQWLPGMTQIGDMFNRELRHRVEGLCADLSSAMDAADEAEFSTRLPPTDRAGGRTDHDSLYMKPMEPIKPMKAMEPMKPMHGFESARRNAGGRKSWANRRTPPEGRTRCVTPISRTRTGWRSTKAAAKSGFTTPVGHKISGVQQRQSGGARKLVFTSEQGEMNLAALKQV